MKTFLLRILILLSASGAFLFPSRLAAQIDLGAAANYCLFTGMGAVNNTGTSHITGNIGTNDGTISSFGPPSTHTGNLMAPGSATAAVQADLIEACTQLREMTATSPAHHPVFGDGEIILPGVHFVNAAGSLNGVLMLNANDNANATFIFRIGGAFSADAFSSIILMNGAKAANVYFIVSGEITIAEGSDIKGTWIGNDGSASMGAGSMIEGRLLSVTGAINVESVTAGIPANILLADQPLHGFTVLSEAAGNILHWLMSPTSSTHTFGVERAGSDLVFHNIAIINTPGNTSKISCHWLDAHPLSGISFYRVRIISPNELVRYSEIRKILSILPAGYVIYPNPVTNRLISVSFKDRPAGKYQVQIYTSSGVLVISRLINHNGTDKSQSIVINGTGSFTRGYLSITDPHHTKHLLSFFSHSN